MTEEKAFDVGVETHRWAESCNLACHYFSSLDSTNLEAKKEETDYPSLLVTSYQPRGRGRKDRTWTTPSPGDGLLSSWCFSSKDPIFPILSPLCGLAVFTALIKTWPEGLFSIKAPNDLYCGDKKVGGLLIETSSGKEHTIVIGLGLNVFSCPPLSTATYLSHSTSIPVDQKTWRTFLEHLFVELTEAVVRASGSELQPADQNNILKALNLYPSLEESYVKIHTDGSLETSEKIISWRDL